MNIKTGQAIALSAALMVVSGCNTTSFKNIFTAKVSPKSEITDPLANVPGSISDEFLTAKKELDAPEHTLLQFARWREDMGDHVAAMDRYRQILKANSKCVEARLGIARIEKETGRVEAAQQILEATAQQHPNRSDVWISMGQLHMSQDNYAAAITSLQKAVDLDSQDQGARYELGLAYARDGQVKLAQPHLAFAVGKSAASYNIGYVLNNLGRKQEAIQWFEQAITNNPDDRTLHATQKMLAALKSNAPGTMIASRKKPATVDVELTSYQAYRETPQIAVTPDAQQPQPSVAHPSTNPSVFRQAVQSRTIESPDKAMQTAMTNLAAQARQPNSTHSPVDEVSGRARIENLPNWGGPSAPATTAPLIQNRFGQRQNSVIEPKTWPNGI